MWSSASALPSRLGCQRYEVQLLHISSALPELLKMWSFASALLLCLDCQRSEVPLSVLPLGQDFERSRSSSTLVLPGLPSMGDSTSAFYLCWDFQRCEVAFPHFCAALTAKDVKCRFSYLRSARTRKISFIFHTCSARTSKYGQVHFRISSLPGLPKIATVSKHFKINLEGQIYVRFYIILSRNVKIFGIMASL